MSVRLAGYTWISPASLERFSHMEQNNPASKAQIVYFSHGGGPLPILGDPGHKAMVEFMQALP